MRDTIVVGAGFSGLMGALALAEAGRRPLLLAKGHGATHWTGGTIDIWGAAGDAGPRAAVAALAETQPEHPYTLVGTAGLDEALARFRALVADARYPYAGSLDRNLILPTGAGALRPTALVPATMAAGDMRLGGELLIAGFHELRDFFPPMAAATLSAQGHPARGIYLELPAGTSRRLDFNPRSFAELFEQPAFRADVGRQLRAVRGSATRIGLPAVLGLRDPLTVVEDLQRLSGAQIFEIPTLPPSVPGLRLLRIFERAIEAAGGRIQIGSFVQRAEGRDGRLEVIFSEAAAREQRHKAGTFMLATGGIAGGGVRTDHLGNVVETAFGLPLRAPAGRGAWFAPRFRDPSGHPIFRAGVVVDERMRPVHDGRLLYENVTVGGIALAGADPVRERCYAGLALSTGWRAGKLL